MPGGSPLPSWSWLGWKEGSLQFGHEHRGELYDDMSEERCWMTKSITQSYSPKKSSHFQYQARHSFFVVEPRW